MVTPVAFRTAEGRGLRTANEHSQAASEHPTGPARPFAPIGPNPPLPLTTQGRFFDPASLRQSALADGRSRSAPLGGLYGSRKCGLLVPVRLLAGVRGARRVGTAPWSIRAAGECWWPCEPARFRHVRRAAQPLPDRLAPRGQPVREQIHPAKQAPHPRADHQPVSGRRRRGARPALASFLGG